MAHDSAGRHTSSVSSAFWGPGEKSEYIYIYQWVHAHSQRFLGHSINVSESDMTCIDMLWRGGGVHPGLPPISPWSPAVRFRLMFCRDGLPSSSSTTRKRGLCRYLSTRASPFESARAQMLHQAVQENLGLFRLLGENQVNRLVPDLLNAQHFL